jgi:hypothetical protein
MKLNVRRFYALILAMYVLALTFDPCVDADRSCTGLQVSEQESGNPGTGAEHKDLCSPFCTCSCCNLSMEVAAALILPATPICMENPTCFFDPQLVSFFIHSIWEPPKA